MRLTFWQKLIIRTVHRPLTVPEWFFNVFLQAYETLSPEIGTNRFRFYDKKYIFFHISFTIKPDTNMPNVLETTASYSRIQLVLVWCPVSICKFKLNYRQFDFALTAFLFLLPEHNLYHPSTPSFEFVVCLLFTLRKIDFILNGDFLRRRITLFRVRTLTQLLIYENMTLRG